MSENDSERHDDEGDLELDAILALQRVLKPLDASARSRVLRWAADRFRPGQSPPEERQTQSSDAIGGSRIDLSPPVGMEDFASLHDAFRPKSDAERALIAAYWFQQIQKRESFKSQELNEELKNLGHGVGNITDALGSLISRSPAFALQLQKSGKSRQARKTFKLTTAGLRAVSDVLSGSASESGT